MVVHGRVSEMESCPLANRSGCLKSGYNSMDEIRLGLVVVVIKITRLQDLEMINVEISGRRSKPDDLPHSLWAGCSAFPAWQWPGVFWSGQSCKSCTLALKFELNSDLSSSLPAFPPLELEPVTSRGSHTEMTKVEPDTVNRDPSSPTS
jgi:hypothetical protein